jgi:hypothetical protein
LLGGWLFICVVGSISDLGFLEMSLLFVSTDCNFKVAKYVKFLPSRLNWRREQVAAGRLANLILVKFDSI